MMKVILVILLAIIMCGCASNAQYYRTPYFYDQEYPGPHEGYRSNTSYNRGGYQ